MIAIANDSERDWQTLGSENPYFGVVSHQKYLTANLDEESKREFFSTGERHVEHVYAVIRSGIHPGFQPARALDYGCGVGRVLVPLARRAQQVVGVDISRSMLAHAHQACQQHGVSARLLHSGELDSLTPGSFDLVHSYIVFQHIPVACGEAILGKLVALLAAGGVGVLHFTYSSALPPIRRAVLAMRTRVNLLHGMLNVVQGRPFLSPLMQMNSYSTNRIFDILIDLGCSNLRVEFSDHSGFRGVLLYFVKSPAPLL
jgi:2-polyprenyl-3-methyl-5-hydroxy-6-metoxy-1,4-benzoquinol methylase